MQEIIEKKAKEYSLEHARQYYHHEKHIPTSSEEEVYQAYVAAANSFYNRGYHDAEEHYINVIESQHKLVEESRMKAEEGIKQLKRQLEVVTKNRDELLNEIDILEERLSDISECY